MKREGTRPRRHPDHRGYPAPSRDMDAGITGGLTMLFGGPSPKPVRRPGGAARERRLTGRSAGRRRLEAGESAAVWALLVAVILSAAAS